MNYKKSGAFFAAAIAAALVVSPSFAAKKVKWKMHSAWGSSVPHLGTSGVRFAKNIKRMSSGNFTMKFFEPGALIPGNEGFDATSKGSVEAAWTTAGYDVGKHPALAFFTAVPFGPSMGEYFAWKMFLGTGSRQPHPLRSTQEVNIPLRKTLLYRYFNGRAHHLSSEYGA